jgi:hypothetical protein
MSLSCFTVSSRIGLAGWTMTAMPSSASTCSPPGSRTSPRPATFSFSASPSFTGREAMPRSHVRAARPVKAVALP